MLRHCLLFLVTFMSLSLAAQVQSPSEFLGYEIGTQFSRHSDIIRYFEHVAAQSDLVTYHTYGKTNERRPLTYAVVTSSANHHNLESIRKANLAQAGLAQGSTTSEKAIVWLSYNVHGNEASSSEATMQTLYELITKKKDWLKNTVVIIDPCVNPDGRDRYANWYNQVAATPYDPLQVAQEHDEPWPGGRPNHYLFDLNRDWAWATQIETQNRIKVYNQWMPHVHVDFHEQGINQPYYFAPAAEPFHEVITDWQRDFQTQIGKNHARYFDQEGWLFFTKERFDLLYPSYGDTYPTYMGAIGMTYEQAGHGRAGLGIYNDEGYELTLKDRIAHHNTTGLSTVEMASKNAQKLNTEFARFFKDNDNIKYKSYVLTGNKDHIKALTALLDTHEIAYGFSTNGRASGYHYTKKTQGSIAYDLALVISTDQPKGKMVKVLFEPDAVLTTPLTYDITAWSLPYAYGLETIASTRIINPNTQAPWATETLTASPNAAGYLAKWDSMDDARFLGDLLKQGIKVRYTERPLTNQGVTYPPGTLILTKSDNKTNPDFHSTVTRIANTHQRSLTATTTSFSTSGPDFGSPDIKLINTPKVAIVRGDQVSSLSYGATWHYFEQQLHYPLTSLAQDRLSRTDLSQFTVLILPDSWGNYLEEGALDNIKKFVRKGGKVIAIAGALRILEGKEGLGLSINTPDKEEKETTTSASQDRRLTPYADREKAATPNLITGSIFKVTLDNTHPLGYGYSNSYHTLKLGASAYNLLDNGYNVGYIKGDAVNVAGFAGETAKAKLPNSLIFGEKRLGQGSFIYMVDDPLFRGFWQNGKLFMANAVFLVNNAVFRL